MLVFILSALGCVCVCVCCCYCWLSLEWFMCLMFLVIYHLARGLCVWFYSRTWFFFLHGCFYLISVFGINSILFYLFVCVWDFFFFIFISILPLSFLFFFKLDIFLWFHLLFVLMLYIFDPHYHVLISLVWFQMSCWFLESHFFKLFVLFSPSYLLMFQFFLGIHQHYVHNLNSLILE